MKKGLCMLVAVLLCLMGFVFTHQASAAMDVTSLNGSYKIGELSNTLFKQSNASSVFSIVGGNDIRVTFNGNGSCGITYSWLEFDEAFSGQSTLYNAIFTYPDQTPIPAPTCSYTVDPDGAVVLSLSSEQGTQTISGWHVSANGETLLKSDVFSEPDQNNTNAAKHSSRIMTGIKLGSGKTNASLSGIYMIAEMDTTLYLPDASTVRTMLGGNVIQANFAGNGTCTVSDSWKEFMEGYSGSPATPLYDQVTYNADPPSSPSCSYNVAEDGAVTLLIGGQSMGGWHVSANGNALLKSSVATESTGQGGTGYSGKIFVGIKLDETNSMDSTKLSGIYKVGAFEASLFKPTNSSVTSVIGGDDIRIYFDGSSTCSVRSSSSEFEEGHMSGTTSILYDQVTLHANPVESPTCEYTVGAVGDLTLTINGTEIIGGWLASKDGSMILKSEVIAEPTDNNSGIRNTSRLFVGTRLQGALSGSATGAYSLTDNLLTITWSESTIPCNAGPTPGSTENQTITALTATSMTWLDGGNTMTWTRTSGTIGDITGVWFTVEPSSGNTYSAEFINGTVSVTGQVSQCNNPRTQITGFSPAFGTVGSSVTIFGENFGHTMPGNYVWFNGAAATVTAASSNQITVTVPTGASTGRIAVSNPNGTSASFDNFTVGAGFVNYTSRVTDSSGIALTGVLVELLDSAISTTTDGNGSFTITVPTQTNVYLKMSLAGYLPAVSSAMTFSQNTDTSNRPFALFTSIEQDAWYSQAGVTKKPMTGIITSRTVSTRNPLFTLPGVTISATDGTNNYQVKYSSSDNPSDKTVSSSATSTTGNGKFYILNVPNGTLLTVTASKSDYSNGTKSYQVATDTVSEGRITLATTSTTYTYIGKIQDSAATPLVLSGVSVFMFKDDGTMVGSATTDSLGLFQSADMVSGTPYYFNFTKTSYLDTFSGNMTVTADIDRSDRPFVLFPSPQITTWGLNPALGVISGSVKNNFDSAGISGATITAVDATDGVTNYSVKYDDDLNGTNAVNASGATSTNASGRFYVKDVPNGAKVTITATAAGFSNNSRSYHVTATKLSQGSIYLNSTVAAGGTITASSRSISFGNIPINTSATQQIITVGNSGPGNLTVSNATSSGNPAFTISSGGNSPCPALPHTFASGENCTLAVNFTPTSTGTKLASMTIFSDDINTPNLVITLNGTGIATVPGIPTSVTVTPWDGEVTVAFNAPLSDGGSTILGYTVTTVPAVTPVSTTGSPITVTGLTNGQSYQISVTAYNSVGTGTAYVTNATPIFAPVRVGTKGYTDFPSAYTDPAVVSGPIKIPAGTITIPSPPMLLNLAKSISVDGGYMSDYSAANPAVNNGFTTFVGRVNISSGRIIFKNIKIK